MGCSCAGHTMQCGWQQLGQIKFDKKTLRITIWIVMIITSLTSYFWICNFGELSKNFVVLFVFLSLSAHFPEYWHIFPTMLLLISSKFIISYSCSFLFVIVKSCNDLNVQQMGMRQNILNIWLKWLCGHPIRSSPFADNPETQSLAQSHGNQDSHEQGPRYSDLFQNQSSFLQLW